MATILKSTTVSLATGLNPDTTRKMVQKGDAAVTTPGTSGFDTVTLASPTLDTAYTAATLLAPILLGVDDITFKPLQYPEPAVF